MNTLELPEQLKGLWEHVLVLTYGVDIPFFERSLWPQFAKRCRNKIILADGLHYLQACESYAQQKGLVRHLNQSYVVAGIFGPHATHAKLILLTNAEQGRLLIPCRIMCKDGVKNKRYPSRYAILYNILWQGVTHVSRYTIHRNSRPTHCHS